MKPKSNILLSSFREIIFGLEDGIVSTLGVITGIAEGTQDRFTILLVGMVVIAVESLSMAAGTYLSDKSEEQALARNTTNKIHTRLHLKAVKSATTGALFMGIAYIIGGAMPVLPYFFVPIKLGIITSVLFAITSLLIIGIWKAKVTGTNPIKSAFEMVFISISAAAIGFIIGKIAVVLYPQLIQVGLTR